MSRIQDFIPLPHSHITPVHCTKNVRIRSYSGPHFPAFGLNTESYSVSLRIHSECGKMTTRITPNTDTFHAMVMMIIFLLLTENSINYNMNLQNFTHHLNYLETIHWGAESNVCWKNFLIALNIDIELLETPDNDHKTLLFTALL